MNLEKRIQSIAALKNHIVSGLTELKSENPAGEWAQLLERTYAENGWFTKSSVIFALEQWVNSMTPERLSSWISKYNLPEDPKKVLVITAGNIPLVGFHDILSVLLSDHKLLLKPSSEDQVLIKHLLKVLQEIEPAWIDRISFVEKPGNSFDAVIATGSNNTARYFEHYFKGVPHILRKNRNSLAIIDRDTTDSELEKLAEDVFRYYGLGCRSISKLFVPAGFDLQRIFQAFQSHSDVLANKKYYNNYMYYRTIYMMNKLPFLDNGFFILKEDDGLASPVANLFYEYYSDKSSLKEKIKMQMDNLQCLVGKGYEPFGTTQSPTLEQYADGVDTVSFLGNI